MFAKIIRVLSRKYKEEVEAWEFEKEKVLKMGASPANEDKNIFSEQTPCDSIDKKIEILRMMEK